ncbi:MAG: hypothetical protein WC878_04845 [Candidatus Paceibacterota bacterium]|jgi:hypothetical protein
MRKKYTGKIDIPAIVRALEDAERLIRSDDKDDRWVGEKLKKFFLRLLDERRRELREAIERAATLKRKKIWRETPRKDD